MTGSSSSDARIAIIGGGVAGFSVAYSLVERGARDVTVVEAEHIATGSSSLSVGMVETQYFNPVDVHARVIGRELVDKLVHDHHLRFTRNGFLRPATEQAHLDLFERSVAVQQSFGVSDAAVLDTSDVLEVAPPLNGDRLVGGLWRPSDGYLDGYLFTALLAELAHRRGARTLLRRKLTRAEKAATDGWNLVLSDGSRLEADVVVNAAGPWAAKVGRLLGSEVNVKPERHQALTIELRKPVDWILPCVVDYIPGSHEDGLSLRHEGTRQLFATLHNEQSVLPASDPDSYKSRVDADFEEVIVGLVMDRYNGLNDCSLGHAWAGLYPMTPDGYPIVGRANEDPTIVHAVGGCGSGIQVATAMGEVAADWVLDAVSTRLTDGHYWSPRRFCGSSTVSA